ncbi:MAG: hypothetical protein D6690_14615 [Nitrospirae bacterium]|nr:MAG: hypothetical protein D6690_14615 [Nitrospirota bacterium]
MLILTTDIKTLAEPLCNELRHLNITLVRVRYDGSDYDGDIKTLQLFDYENIDISDLSPHGIIRQTSTLFLDILHEYDPLWDAEEGSFGSFDWDLLQRTLHHEHNKRYIDHTTDDCDIEF